MDKWVKFYKLGFHYIERREEESEDELYNEQGEDEVNNEQLLYYLDLETLIKQLQQRFDIPNIDLTSMTKVVV